MVGFTLTGKQAQQQLGALASASGGVYYSAEDGPALSRALVAATISRFPYSILDASGAVVARGEAGDNGQELPAGTYRIVVQAGDTAIALDGVAVAAGGTSAVRVQRQGDRFVLAK